MPEVRMNEHRGPAEPVVPPIRGGSLTEADLPTPAEFPAVHDVARAAARARSDTPLAQALRRLARSTTALVGAAIVALLIVVAIFADVLAPQSPIVSDQTQTFAAPSWAHPLGTDQLGRDMLSRVIHGSRLSLVVGVSSVLLALFVGVPLGMLAGFYGGRLDTVVMRVMDLILAFPIYLLAIILMIIFTPTAGLIGAVKVTGAIAIVRIPIYARLVRGSVLSIKEKEYVEACRALGVRDPWLLFGHILPNCLAPIIVTTTLGIATSIIVEATLSFLGLGTQPPTPSWGWDLKANIAFIQANLWLSLFPGLAIFVTVLGFNLFGDGLRDALDPRLK
jgi:peptide/nickel transport system permease protein